MILFFKRLFNVSVEHDFYTNGLSKDLDIFPTAETKQLLKNSRMVYKNMENGITVVYKATDDNIGGATPLVDIEDDVTFTFVLQINNKEEFLNITNLDDASPVKKYTGDKIVHFTNNGTSSALQYNLIDSLRPTVFTYEFSFASPTGTGTLEIVDQNSTTVLTIASIPVTPDNTYRQALDLRTLSKGKYTFKFNDDTNPQEEETIYIDNDLAQKDVFGILDISYLASDLYTTTEQFDMTFARKETRWKYYIVNKSGIALDVWDLIISDTSGDDGTVVYDEYTFGGSQSPDPVNAVNGFETLVFTSGGTIPYFEVPKLGLQLKREDQPGGGKPGVPPGPPIPDVVLIKNLPNPMIPGVSDEFAEVIVFV